MREVTPGYVKALFGQLVKVVGGVDAAGAHLGISFQRVSQLQSLNCADMPTLMQVIQLQAAAERPIVTDALSDLVAGVRASRDLQKETREALHAAAHLDALAASDAPPKAIDDGLARLQREVADVVHLRAVND